MTQLFGHASDIPWVVTKGLLLFVLTIVGLRLSERRLLSELNIFDVVVAIAIGSVLGRTVTSTSASFITGAAALVTLLVAHRLVSVLHRRTPLRHLLDRPPLVIVEHGKLRPDALVSAGLTERDVYRMLRQEGVDLEALDFVIFEETGKVSIVKPGQRDVAVRHGLHEAHEGGPSLG